jgi:predicted GNAT family acetyltransferase
MEIQFKIDNHQQGSFFIEESGNQIAELDFAINGDVINAYHTGVRKEYEGQGIAGKLFDKLVSYARENGYKIIPACSYILVKFRRHPELFEDLWVHSEDEPSGDACGLKPR